MASAAIFGCQGTELTVDEKAFFADADPWGFILFARNVRDPEQVRALVSELRATIGRDDAPVLIDQEGGRVQRLNEPHWPQYPSAARLAELDGENARLAVWTMSRLHAFDLQALGINVNCLPLLDVPVEGASSIIGERAYGTDVDVVSTLGQAACDGLLAGGVLPVVKHIPGHGRAMVDSHLELPRVDASANELRRVDFEPFRRLSGQALAMTAHVVYEAFDSKACATLSPTMIGDIIRTEIGFDGLLMTDDLSMHALSGDFASRTRAAFAAGCDIVLHCNGDQAEMQAVADALTPLSMDASRRARAALGQIGRHDDSDEAALRDSFSKLIGQTTQ